MDKKLIGKTAIITGASRGLGYEIARTFIKEGAVIIIISHSHEIRNAFNVLVNEKPNFHPHSFEEFDVSSYESVMTFWNKIVKIFPKIDILVNCAGIQGPKGSLETLNWEDWVKTIQINLFGTVLMCGEAVRHFKKNNYGKIINLSGGGATKPFPNFSAYATSKGGVVHFTETLAEEVRQYGIDINAVAPGAMNTRMLDEVLEAGPNKVGKENYEKAVKQKENGGTSLSKATELVVFLASSESDGISGKLISAVWDNWEDFVNRKEELKGDIYTLRRKMS